MDDTAFAHGLLLGVLIGDGHFGGDRLQPQVTLKMHVRRKPLLDWLLDRCPGARLYGPYEHDGRRFYQFMVRGNALRYRLMPLLDGLPWSEIDPHTYDRYLAMKRRYGLLPTQSDGIWLPGEGGSEGDIDIVEGDGSATAQGGS